MKHEKGVFSVFNYVVKQLSLKYADVYFHWEWM